MIGTLASGWKGLGASAVFCTTVYDCSRKSALGSQPIKCKPKTDHELMTRVLSCFRQFLWFYLVFFHWLAIIFFFSITTLGRTGLKEKWLILNSLV